MSETKRKPEWAPDDSSSAFASRIVKGVEDSHDGLRQQTRPTSPPKPALRRKRLSVDEYVEGVLAQDRTILARTITLVR